MPLVLRGNAQRAQRLRGELPVRGKQLGSSSEVNGFRVQVRDSLLVKRVHPVPAFQLLNLKCVGFTIRGANAYEDAIVWSQPLQIMGACVAGVYLDRQNIQVPPRHHFDLRYEAWPYRIGDKVCELLLGFE